MIHTNSCTFRVPCRSEVANLRVIHTPDLSIAADCRHGHVGDGQKNEAPLVCSALPKY